MRFITLTRANITTTNGGTRLVCRPNRDLNARLSGHRVQLVYLQLTGPNVDLYRLKYISMDVDSSSNRSPLWCSEVAFDSTTDSVKAINVSSGHAHRYTEYHELVFNLLDDQFEPVRSRLEYSDVLIELAIYA
jgi:hypothetical protein